MILRVSALNKTYLTAFRFCASHRLPSLLGASTLNHVESNLKFSTLILKSTMTTNSATLKVAKQTFIPDKEKTSPNKDDSNDDDDDDYSFAKFSEFSFVKKSVISISVLLLVYLTLVETAECENLSKAEKEKCNYTI